MTEPVLRKPAHQCWTALSHTTIDMGSAAGRRFRHLVDSYSAELGTELSEAELSLVRQACALQLEAERMQAAIVRCDSTRRYRNR
jgi:hypothetical protein